MHPCQGGVDGAVGICDSPGDLVRVGDILPPTDSIPSDPDDLPASPLRAGLEAISCITLTLTLTLTITLTLNSIAIALRWHMRLHMRWHCVGIPTLGCGCLRFLTSLRTASPFDLESIVCPAVFCESPLEL